MILTKEFALKTTDRVARDLKAARLTCAQVWNDCLALAKEHRLQHEGQWISKKDLEQATKGGKYQLHSQSIQAIITDYTEARQMAQTKRKQGDTNARYPWRQKKYRTIEFKQMAIRQTTQNTIRLTLWKGQHFDTGLPWQEGIGVARLTWDRNRYVLQYTVEVSTPELPTEAPLPETTGGIDIGEIHPAALTTASGDITLITGRAIRSIKQFRNKRLAGLYRRRSRCRKGSRRHRKYGRLIARACQKAENSCRDAFHKATRLAVTAAEAQGLTTVVIGDPKGVADKTKQQRRLSRKSRQKIAQMETGTIKQYLQYKFALAGIRTILTEERGTTSGCPVCGTSNHCSGREYRCSCGFVAHRDGKAGFMILRKVLPEVSTPESFRLTALRALPKYRVGTTPPVDGTDCTRRSNPVRSFATDHPAGSVILRAA